MTLKTGESTLIDIDAPEVQVQLGLIMEKAKLIHQAQKRICHYSRFLLAGAIVGGLMALLGLVFSSNALTYCALVICATIIPFSCLLSWHSNKWNRRADALDKEMEAFHDSTSHGSKT